LNFHYNPRGNYYPGSQQDSEQSNFGGLTMKIINTAIIGISMMLAAVPAVAGDAAAGKSAFSSKGCAGCHGADGGTPMMKMDPPIPKLAGKDAAFVKKQLTDFKSGARKSATMNAMAGMLSDADIDNVAAYLGTQK
jgi:cytochrome c553